MFIANSTTFPFQRKKEKIKGFFSRSLHLLHECELLQVVAGQVQRPAPPGPAAHAHVAEAAPGAPPPVRGGHHRGGGGGHGGGAGVGAPLATTSLLLLLLLLAEVAVGKVPPPLSGAAIALLVLLRVRGGVESISYI